MHLSIQSIEKRNGRVPIVFDDTVNIINVFGVNDMSTIDLE